MNTLLEKAKKIKCLICDIDGVLTDGRLYLDEMGKESKAFHVQDGMGLKLLMAADISVAVITTSANPLIDYRMKHLGIQHYFKGQVNKQAAFLMLQSRLNLESEAFAYVGDDLPDIWVLQQVGLSVAVANAVPAVKDCVAWQTERKGGEGAVREVCDLILNAQAKADLALERYLSTCLA